MILICCLLTVPALLSGPADGSQNSGTVALIGTIPLVAYNISVTGIDTSDATVFWETNGNANSTVEYGTTPGYGSVGFDAVMGTSHTITLNGLSSYTTYHYRIASTNLDGESYVSSDFTFQTSASSGTIVDTNLLSTTFPGLTVQTLGSTQQISLNLTTTLEPVQVSGNTITEQNPGRGWSNLQIVGSNVITDNGNVSTGQILSVSLQSDLVTASLGGTIGTVSTQIDIGLTQVVSDLTIQQSIIQGASTTVADAYQIAATNNNLDVKAIAYTVEFQNTAPLDANLNSDGVTLNLSIDNAWVVANAPDGSVNNVKIFRLGEDGTAEVLSTTYIGSQGTTDYFEATSPRGLSTFGIVAVASTSSTGSSSNGGTSGESSGGGGGGVGSAPAAALAAQPANPFGQPILAPLEQMLAGPPVAAPNPATNPGTAVPAAAESYPAGFAGLSYNANGQGTLSIDTGAAQAAGATITMDSDHITVYQHHSPGVLLTFWGNNFEINNGTITGPVSRAELVTDPLDATLALGNVSGSVHAALPELIGWGNITLTISENLSTDTLSRFQDILTGNGLRLNAVAYTLDVQKVNLTTGPANVTFTVPSSWVNEHGGKDAVRITRISEETGKQELLNTVYEGIDSQGNMIFRGDSPECTSLFGLVTAGQNAYLNAGMFAILLGVIALLAVIAYLGWWTRRL